MSLTEEEILKNFKDSLSTNVIESQQEYYWIRLYINEESEFSPKDIITMTHLPTNESIDLIFTNYDKKKRTNKQSEDLEEFTLEEDKEILCLLVNMTKLHSDTDKDFIRTLFRKSKFYKERLLKRKDIKFELNGNQITYYDVMF